MKGILLVSHGKLSEGMKDSLQLFSGKLEQLDSLSLNAEQDIQEFGNQLKEKVDMLDSGQGVVIFCDLAFGTPSNVSAQLLKSPEYKDRVQIVSGMNLPMVLEFIHQRTGEIDFSDLIQIGKEGIIDFNELLKAK